MAVVNVVAAALVMGFAVATNSPELEQQQQQKNSIPKECICSGWKPQTGKWKGTGNKCAFFGWTTEWCYVSENYVGPGHEFVKPSSSYKGKFYSPCVGLKNKPPSKKCQNVQYPVSADDDAQSILNRQKELIDKNPSNPMVSVGTYSLNFLNKQLKEKKCGFAKKSPGYLLPSS